MLFTGVVVFSVCIFSDSVYVLLVYVIFSKIEKNASSDKVRFFRSEFHESRVPWTSTSEKWRKGRNAISRATPGGGVKCARAAWLGLVYWRRSSWWHPQTLPRSRRLLDNRHSEDISKRDTRLSERVALNVTKHVFPDSRHQKNHTPHHHHHHSLHVAELCDERNNFAELRNYSEFKREKTRASNLLKSKNKNAYAGDRFIISTWSKSVLH